MPVVVNESESSKLQYTFTTTNHSIGFGVNFFRDDGKKLVLLAPRQFNSHQTPIQGEVAVEGRGVLSVIWDNGYSWSDQSMSSHIKIEYANALLPDNTIVDNESTASVESINDTKVPEIMPGKADSQQLAPTQEAAAASMPVVTVPTTAITSAASTEPSTTGVRRVTSSLPVPVATGTTTATTTASPVTDVPVGPVDRYLDAKCKYLFTQFDQDKDGYLNCAELKKFTETVNVSPEKIDDAAWIKLCKYWSLDPIRGMDYDTLLKVYRAVPGSVDSDMQKFFRKNPTLVNQIKHRYRKSSACVPTGYVEVEREDGSTYWTDPGMTHVIEGRAAPVLKDRVASACSASEAKSGAVTDPSTRRNSISAGDMIHHIFVYFDRDGDGFLNHPEMQRFSRVINNATRRLSRMDWLRICQYWGATHKGITADHLRQIYENDGDSSLENDYATIQRLEQNQQRIKSASSPLVQPRIKSPPSPPTAEAETETQVDSDLAKEDQIINQMTSDIFQYFDKDRDGFLNTKEMVALSKATEEEGVRITEDKWEETCKVMGVNPVVGLVMTDLLRVYHRDVDKDYREVFGAQKFARDVHHSFTIKAKAIFDKHDVDRDGFLNRAEMNAFTLATEDDQEALDEEQWQSVCRDMMIDPKQGIALTHLITIYKQILQDDYKVLCHLRESNLSDNR